MARWDVIVVGARLGGSSTAMLLARAGLRVLVVDRARRGSDTLSTHALMRAGVLQLFRWGVLDRAVSGATPVRRTVFHHYGEDPVTVSIRASHGVPALYAPRRTVLDLALADAADEAGAVVRHGTTVSALLREPDGRVVGVRLRDRSGREQVERATLVVGADGRRSLVADAVDAAVLHRGSSAVSYLYTYVADLPVAGYEWFYSDRVVAGLIPTNDGATGVFVGAGVDDIDRLTGVDGTAAALAAVTRRLPSLAERVRAATQAGAVRYARGTPGFLRQAHGPGWALVGDAGYWKDPLSTHGMSDAMRDAELLARGILAGLDGAGLPVGLAEYQAKRDLLSRPMFEVVDEMASLSWDRSRIRTLLRTLSSLMTDQVEALEGLEAPLLPSGPGGAVGRVDAATGTARR